MATNPFSRAVNGLYRAISSTKEFDDIGEKVAMKKSGLTEVVDVENNIYDEAVLKRSLPYVTKLDLETKDKSVENTVTTVIVEYKNGLSMKAECTRTPVDTEELVNIAVCGSQQVLSSYVHRALFSYAARVRVVRRHVLESTRPNFLMTDLVKFSDSMAACDFGRFAGAVPYGAPSLREVLLTVPMAAVEKDHDLRSSSQVKEQRIREVGIIAQPTPPAKPTISRDQANRATKAMADLLKAVRIDDNNTPDHPDEGEF